VLHWIRDQDAVLRGVSRALVPGGRFAAEFGGHGCVAAIVVALVAVLERRGIDGSAAIPWTFPTVHEYTELLERHGFAIDTIALVPRPTPLPTDMRGWLETFAKPFWSGLEERDRPALLDETVRLLRPVLCDRSGRWTADYVRLRFLARLR
jgi:trans-aconitate methyltransferase